LTVINSFPLRYPGAGGTGEDRMRMLERPALRRADMGYAQPKLPP